MENEEKLGQEPAFRLPMHGIDRMPTLNINALGMSKRFYAACAAMQGLLSQHYQSHKEDESQWVWEPLYKSEFLTSFGVNDNEQLVIDAYAIADELIKQEDL